jgi:hypothetical protein
MAPPETITTHHIIILVIVPYVENARLPAASLSKCKNRRITKSDTAREAVSMRVPAIYTMHALRHTGRRKTTADPNRVETIATDS